MTDIRRENLKTQYEDAAIALLMDGYAEALGQCICEQMEDSADCIPAELDVRCQTLIRKEFSKARHKAAAKRAQRNLFHAAVFVFALLGLCTTTVFSVEAFRVPVMKFFLEIHNQYTTVAFESDESAPQSPESPLAEILPAEGTVQEGHLAGLLPDSYYLIRSEETSEQSWETCYAKGPEEDDRIAYGASPIGAISKVDTEDVVRTEEMTLSGFPAFFIEKDGHYYEIIWADTGRGTVISLRASNMTYDDFMALAEAAASEQR